jgi:hypothetical protein
MYLELLKELYYKERKKLEDMWIFKEESKLKLLRTRRDIVNKIERCLTITEILGRSDIAEEIKDKLLRDRNNEDKIKERLDAIIGDELSQIDNEEKEELRNANYSAFDFAEYLFQLEKVSVLESELENNRLFPDAVYEEQKEMPEAK